MADWASVCSELSEGRQGIGKRVCLRFLWAVSRFDYLPENLRSNTSLELQKKRNISFSRAILGGQSRPRIAVLVSFSASAFQAAPDPKSRTSLRARETPILAPAGRLSGVSSLRLRALQLWRNVRFGDRPARRVPARRLAAVSDRLCRLKAAAGVCGWLWSGPTVSPEFGPMSHRLGPRI